MRKILQTISLAAYRIVASTGFFETEVGKKLFFLAYDFYKERVESGAAETLKRWAISGTSVIDVGANVGFFTVRFSRWVGQDGQVIAIEPEAENIRKLNQRLKKAGADNNVEVIEGVAAEKAGQLHLVLNPYHPADHKIGVSGVQVRAWTIDEISRERHWPKVSLIKIDVQGSEIRVLRGAKETITRWRPAMFIEVHDEGLIEAGFSAEQLFDEIRSFGYKIYDSNEPFVPLTTAEAAELRRELGYYDYLCHAQ